MLDLILMHDGQGWEDLVGSHRTLSLSLREWEAIIAAALGIQVGNPGTAPCGAADLIARNTRRFRRILQALDYPKLSKLADYYADTWYDADELEQLGAECARLSAVARDRKALEGLEVLSRACREARVRKLGIFAVAD